MANLLVIDGQGQVVYIKASGAGTSLDPFILERFGTINVLASALPDGASVETKQDDQITQLSALVATVDIDKIRTQIMDPIPAGTNKLGSVDVDAIIAALPVGSNKLGSVDVDAIIAALPVGANKIGIVEVDNFPAQLDTVMDGGVGWTVLSKVSSSATPTTPLSCTDLPTAGKAEKFSDILLSSQEDMRITFTAQPSTDVLMVVNIAAYVPVQITPRSEILLPVDNQLQLVSDVDGQLDITTWHREV